MTAVEYIAGLTGFSLDEIVLQRIALDRDVLDEDPVNFDRKIKDLLLADVLYAVYTSGSNIPSFQHSHGQFSTSTGSQNIGSKDSIYQQMKRLYEKWGDDRLESLPNNSLTWME